MLLDLSVTGNVTINATPEKVWNVLTNPAIIKEYLFGAETITDWSVGSPIVFRGEYKGTTYEDHGEIMTNIPLEVISYSYWSGFTGLEDKPENYATVTYIVDKKGENLTGLTWSMKGYSSEQAYNHSKEGMEAFLNQIKAIAER